MNIKYILIICALFLNLKNTKYGKVEYEVEINKLNYEKKLKKGNSEGNKQALTLLKNAYNVNYLLEFSDSESIYRKQRSLNNDSKKGINLTEVFSGGNGIFYFNRITKERLDKIVLGGDSFLVEKETMNWKLTKEEKKIGKYNCLKALNLDIQGKETGIIAWYTTDIPLSYGPSIYNNLPGLIVELQDDLVTYKAKKIELQNEKIVIKKPIDGIKLTHEEFRNRFKGIFEE